MSTPSEKGSISVTSPLPQGDEIQDTASSVQGMGAPPGVTDQFVSNTPNTVFDQQMRDNRTRSVSPRPRRVISPSLSVAQLRAQTAEWKVDTALSSIGQIVDQTIRAQSTADDAIVEAHAVREEVESRISELSRHAEITTSSMLGEFTGQVKQVVEQSEAQTLRAVGSVVHIMVSI